MHKPCLPMGVYGRESGADIMNLLVSKKVDLVLSGHEHGYQRTMQLSHTGTCSTITPLSVNTGCIVDTDGDVAAGAGAVFVTVGTGGIALRDMNESDSEADFFASWSGANFNPTHGLLDVHVTSSRLSASFLRSSGGSFTDSVTLTKGPPPPNRMPVAAFTAARAGFSVTFDGSGSSDPDGDSLSYAWDFGDSQSSTEQKPSVLYPAAGTYRVTLTVSDGRGGSDSMTMPVTVTAAPAPPTGVSLATAGDEVALWWTPPAGESGLTYEVHRSATEGFTPTAATRVAQTPSADWRDQDLAAGTWHYRVVARDQAGNRSDPSTAVRGVVTTSGATAVVRDGFRRAATGAWGTAEIGGAWSLSRAASFGVNGQVLRFL